MNTIDWNNLLKDIITQSETLAQQLISDFTKQGMQDVKDFLTNSKDDLQRWTVELAEQQITKAEFEDLVQGQIDVALLHALKETGLAQIELDKFKNGVVEIIVGVAFDAAKSVL
jgi:DNA topoisomerase VI subunit B